MGSASSINKTYSGGISGTRRTPGEVAKDDAAYEIDDPLVFETAIIDTSIQKTAQSLMNAFVFVGEISVEDIDVAQDMWNKVVSGNVKKYKEFAGKFSEDSPTGSSTRSKQAPSCIDWFVKKFYARLSEADPISQNVYPSAIDAQKRLVTTMLSSLFIMMRELVIYEKQHGKGNKNDESPHYSVYRLAKLHFKLRVAACEYVSIGMSLLDTVAFCFGDEHTSARRDSWNRIFGTLLTNLLPFAIALENTYENFGVNGETMTGRSFLANRSNGYNATSHHTMVSGPAPELPPAENFFSHSSES